MENLDVHALTVWPTPQPNAGCFLPIQYLDYSIIQEITGVIQDNIDEKGRLFRRFGILASEYSRSRV
jgi:hypothetical protein